ncbi:E3 ubiquitin-protein ligase MIB2-like [Montipora capricornis]|uniref:E3 ubiquitin-protein ligase MIB2-like n=1 Tax=Montipora capricornis TaxID=246305 RepID=UPI0035F162B4
MEAGCRVVRGPDWKWDNQDGGEGHVGTVVVVGKSGSVSSPDKTVVVQWDGGTKTNYRCGFQGAFDLCLLDNGPIGVLHTNVPCNECKKQEIEGMRWECCDCVNYNLCSLCYMNDKHVLDHGFSRVEARGKPGVFVGNRLGKCKVQARGIFPGAQVKRGPDWDWGNQDGGPQSIGVVLDVRGWEAESFRSVACVKWKPTSTNVYRVGHKGKVDLKSIADGFGYSYYKNHLPKLGQKPESLIIRPSTQPALSSADRAAMFEIGERVRVLLSGATLKDMQEGHGGWNDQMEEVIGLVGTVHRITERGDVRVQYPGFANRWTFHPAALTKIDEFHVNDRVHVMKDKELVKKLQRGHGEWTNEMTVALDKVGQVLKIYSDGDVRVSVAGHHWTFNPAVLVKQSSPAAAKGGQLNPPQSQQATACNELQGILQPSSSTTSYYALQRQQHGYSALEENRNTHQPQREIDESLRSLLDHLRINSSTDVGSMIVSEAGQGHVDELKRMFKAHPDKVDVVRSDKTALQIASHQGFTSVVELLVQMGANVNLQDSEGDTALHYAAFGNQPLTAAALLKGGADGNKRNKNKCSPLHVAVNKGYSEVVKTLLSYSCNANAQDSYGDTVLHDAIAKDFSEIVELLVNFDGVDLSVKNKRGFNCLHHAALKGNARAVSLIVEKSPDLLNIVKEDGFSALHLASLNGHFAVVNALIEAYPDIDVNLRNVRQQTPLLLAVDKRHVTITRLLLQNGAQVNLQDDVGDSPLHVVVMYHSMKSAGSNVSRKELPATDPTFVITKLLVDHGADISQMNKDNKTPLQLCRDQRLREIMLSRSDTEADLSGINSEAATPPSLDLTDSAQATSSSSVTKETDVKCRLCGIPANAKFNPCGHMLACLECASMLRKCFVCKAVVQSFNEIPQERDSEESLCIVCSDEPPSVTFEPCGHMIACKDCAVRMRKCLKCKATITRKISSKEPSVQVAELSEKDEKYLETLHSLLTLQAHVREIEDANMCAICLEKRRNVAFMCGHGTCATCSTSLEICPMCRKPIDKKITLFN